jgi:hypothetical protein
MILEEKNGDYRWKLALVATVFIGPSCGLPIFVYLRK